MKIAALACLALMGALAISPAHAQSAQPSWELREIETPQQPGQIRLYPGRSRSHEQWMEHSGMRSARNVDVPTLTPYLPDPAHASGAAVIVAPGGGFRSLALDHEGAQVAQWLAAHGVATFVLKYRTVPTPRDLPGYLEHMTQFMTDLSTSGAQFPVQTPETSLQDGLAAIRMVRTRAAEWGVDPQRVGFMGFSAGAYLTLSVALGVDAAARPDFVAPIYGPMTTRAAPADAPPMFLAVALDDPLMVRSPDLGIIQAWMAAGRPVEAHLYEQGGHGFGMRRVNASTSAWIDQFYAWMRGRGIISAD